ncbi:hypothetical protein BD560DRAFT_468952, partial [Blakeslea trispora]
KDTTSLAVKEIRQSYTAFRPGCLIITHNGIEVGTIEIKPLTTYKELVDVDICKVAEIYTADGTYNYFQHGQASLPSFESTVAHMKVFLESFLSFKELIKESLVSEEEEIPSLFDEYSHFVKPTIALKDDKDK